MGERPGSKIGLKELKKYLKVFKEDILLLKHTYTLTVYGVSGVF